MRYFKRSDQAVTIQAGPEDISLELDPDLFGQDGSTLTVDIYAHEDHRHPEGHLGWWRFSLAGASNPLVLTIDLYVAGEQEPIGASSPETGSPLAMVDHWSNPGYLLHPIQDIDLVAKDWGEGEELLRVNCYVRDTSLLAGYYSSDEHQETAYSTANIVLEEFHRHRLRVFKRLFGRYIPAGAKVLDVGSGYSLIRLTRPDWPFEVTCCDLDEAAMHKMAEEAPEYHWVTGDAANLPFEDSAFDAVYAGEIIEHLPDPRSGLTEWLRVLKPGGVFIMSTPNLHRLMNAINRAEDVVNPEHISEMSYRDLEAMLRDAGLEILHEEGIYLEWLFNYFRTGKKMDLLPFHCNKPAFRPLVVASMYAGRVFRPWAQDLVFVARKL